MIPISSSTRIFSLDVLRGLAAALVLIRHAPSQSLANGPVETMFRFFVTIGWTGVDLFFVLSGFLIANTLFVSRESHGDYQLIPFWIRRSFKIWPSYFVAYGTAFGLTVAREIYQNRWNEAGILFHRSWPNFFFLQNYSNGIKWSHSWSLAVEEHFYLLLPLVLIGIALPSKTSLHGNNQILRNVCWLAMGLAIVALGLRCYHNWTSNSWHDSYYLSHCRFDSLFCGVMLAAVYRYANWVREYIRLWLPLGIIALLAGLLCAILDPLEANRGMVVSTIGFSLLMVGSGTLVLSAAFFPDFGLSIPFGARYVFQLLAILGTYSYTVYLAHAAIFSTPGVEGIRQFLLSSLHSLKWDQTLIAWLDRFAYLSVSVLGGVLLSHFIERPFLAIRKAYFATRPLSKEKAAS